MLACERRWAVAILRTFAATGDASPALSDDDYLSGYDALSLRARAIARVGLRLAVWLAWFAPLYVLGRAVTFARLHADDRTEVLERMLAHSLLPVREAAFVLKCVACFALFRDAEFRRATGYDGVANVDALVPLRAPGRGHGA